MTTSAIANSPAVSYPSNTGRYVRASDARNASGAVRETVAQLSDSYFRTVSARAATYSRAAAPALSAAKSMPVATAAERKDTASHYNKILEDLRTKHSEPEAMRLFDEILAADGYEVIGPEGYAYTSSWPSNKVGGLAISPISLHTRTGDDDLLTALMQAGGKRDPDANLIMQSILSGTTIDGEPVVSTESYAIFSAQRPLSAELQDYWHNRYFDEASAQTDIDLEAYMAKLPDSAQRSVVAASTGIADIVNGILKENGIELERGQLLEFHLSDEFGVMVQGGDFGDIFNKSEELAAALRAQAQNPPPQGTANIPGAYEDGDRSVKYTFGRRFTYSADEPSAVVMSDYLGVEGRGYTYVKKAGDYFDPTAEATSTAAGTPIGHMYLYDEAERSLAYSKKNALVNKHIAEALATGRTVGNVSREVIDNETNRANAAMMEQREKLGLQYELKFAEDPDAPVDAASTTMEEPGVEKPKEEKEEAEVLPPEPEEYPETSEQLVEEKRAAMKSMVDALRAQYATLFAEMSSVKNFL